MVQCQWSLPFSKSLRCVKRAVHVKDIRGQNGFFPYSEYRIGNTKSRKKGLESKALFMTASILFFLEEAKYFRQKCILGCKLWVERILFVTDSLLRCFTPSTTSALLIMIKIEWFCGSNACNWLFDCLVWEWRDVICLRNGYTLAFEWSFIPTLLTNYFVKVVNRNIYVYSMWNWEVWDVVNTFSKI